jgi:hypothetical protein
MKNQSKVIFLLTTLGLAGVLAACGTNSTSSGNGSVTSNSTKAGSSTTEATTTSINQSGMTSSGAISVTSGSVTYNNYAITSTTSDESAVKVAGSGAKALVTSSTVTKSGNTSSADNSSFYGLNASMLSTNGYLYSKDTTVNSTAEGGAGLCAAGSSAYAYGYNMTINTTKNAAGGFHVCNDGTLYGYNSTITTAGEHSAALRSDRGGGTMEIEKGTYTSTGAGSPAIYCTADIEVKDATLKASGSEAFAMEGLNTTSLYDSTLEGACPASSQNDNIQWNVICYQSMSGDSTSGTGRFNMVGGTLTAEAGGMFFGTNTDAEFYIKGVTLVPSSANPFLLRATGISRWSNSYSAMKTHFTAEDETMVGDIIHDTMSGMTVDLIGATTWTGASTVSSSYTGSKTSTINLGANAKWIVSGDSTITNLYNAGTIVDASGNTVTIKANGSTVVSGTSSYTISVTSTYSTTDNTASALSAPTWSALPEFPSSL